MNHMRHVLVVEDSDEDFATVLDAARRLGLPNEIRRAKSGDEGLQLLRESLLAIHKDDKLRALPLVVLSTSANPRDLSICYACGANTHHVKPVQHGAHLLVLEQRLDYWLRQAVLPTHLSATR